MDTTDMIEISTFFTVKGARVTKMLETLGNIKTLTINKSEVFVKLGN